MRHQQSQPQLQKTHNQYFKQFMSRETKTTALITGNRLYLFSIGISILFKYNEQISVNGLRVERTYWIPNRQIEKMKKKFNQFTSTSELLNWLWRVHLLKLQTRLPIHSPSIGIPRSWRAHSAATFCAFSMLLDNLLPMKMFINAGITIW